MSKNPYPTDTVQHDLWQLRHELSAAVGGRRGLLRIVIQATVTCWMLALILWLLGVTP